MTDLARSIFYLSITSIFKATKIGQGITSTGQHVQPHGPQEGVDFQMAVAFDPMIIEPVDRLALEAEIAAALNDTHTHIFLDTNVLMWIYGLHQGARSDLCDWLTAGPQAGRIHVPRRVIHEFSAHRDASEKLYPFGQEFKPLAGLMERFEQMAPLVADDAWAASNGFTDRVTYLAQVAAASETLRKLVTPVTKGEKLEKLHEQLLPVFNTLALKGDVFSDLASLRQAYEARAELRVPPGFKDSKKGKAAEAANIASGAPSLAGANRFGDLAIWEEILSFVVSSVPLTTTVVIVTHDTKPDWSYSPRKIIDSDGHTKPNPHSGPAQLSVAQPMLAHELVSRTAATALYIITIPQLAVIANGHEVGFRFSELARAVQVEADDSGLDEPTKMVDEVVADEAQADLELPAGGLGQPIEEAEGGGLPLDEPLGEPTVQEFLANLPAVALADKDYVADPAGPVEFDATIAGLRSNNWYSQNPAIKDAVALLIDGRATLLQAFVFGRNLYQAAVGTAAEAMRLLEDFSARTAHIPENLANAVYAGALFEAYFNNEGDLRHVPKDGQIGELLRHQTNQTLLAAITFIGERLVGAHLLVIPSFEAPLIEIGITFDGDMISGLTYGAIPLTQAYDDTDPTASPLPEIISWKRLRSLVAGYFAAPINQLELMPNFEEARPVAGLQFIRWNPVEGPGLR